MSKYLIVLAVLALASGCSPDRQFVQLIPGPQGNPGADGSSCSVSQAENGALLSCTDGSAVLILNGTNGTNGLNGSNGVDGAVGAAGTSCSVTRRAHQDYVTVACGSNTQRVYDGRDGRNGQDGQDAIGCTVSSLSAAQLSPAGGVKISCGGAHGSTAYVKNGVNGTNGSNGSNGTNGTNASPCTTSKTGATLTISCPGSAPLTVVDGAQGTQGPQGPVGPTGPQGQSYQPSLGLVCQVYDLPGDSGQNRSLPAAFLGAIPKFSTVVSQLNVGDTQSSAGFPFLSPEQKAMIGTDGYAFDCAGFLTVPTTGTYAFNLFSDDGARLAIEGSEVINNDGLHSPSELSASVFLYKGLNRVNVQYYQGPNTQIALKLDWAGPNFTRVNIPSAAFSN